ncbi:uncharacterized protein [Haliotis cracherodii]|uniref:uncharacterized protein n=1 Tax=Haliotis cracherodii TaxID=6455 RepID=UPI0039ED5B66
MTEFSSELFNHVSGEQLSSDRKHMSPRQIQRNIIDLELEATSPTKTDDRALHEFPEFTSDSEHQANLNFHEKLLENIQTLPREPNVEGTSDCDIRRAISEQSTPIKKMKIEIINGINTVTTGLELEHESPTYTVVSPSTDSLDSTHQINPTQLQMMSAMGDTGWYEILPGDNIVSTPVSRKQHLHGQNQLQTVSVLSIPKTTGLTVVSDHQSMTTTPVNHEACNKSNSNTNYVYTPHPRSGQILYITEPNSMTAESPQANVQAITPLLMNKPNMSSSFTPVSQICSQSLVLNSSGEENTSPTEAAPVSTYSCQDDSPVDPNVQDSSSFPLLNSPQAMDEERETHNMKERKRRARIKEACDLMRQLVPGMSEKTDKATVFEFAARYIYFLKNFVGTSHDKDFLIKYSPY